MASQGRIWVQMLQTGDYYDQVPIISYIAF